MKQFKLRTSKKCYKKIFLMVAVVTFLAIMSMKNSGFYIGPTIASYLDIMLANFDQPMYYSNDNITSTLHLVVSVCGDRLKEAIVMLKSVTVFTAVPFHVHAFVSKNLQRSLRRELRYWQQRNVTKMSFSLYLPQFPSGSEEEWRNLFTPCATQRLFLPKILKEVDALLFVDSDVLFLRSLEDIWKKFADFNETQIAALASESESPENNWYAIYNDTPHVPPFGINGGVILFNATRVRQTDWYKNMTDIYEKYRSVVRLADQDIMNIYFYIYPEHFYLLSCDWNYRTDDCEYSSNCSAAERDGVSLVHGNRLVFHHNKVPIFKQLYQSFDSYKLGEDAVKHFNKSVQRILAKTTNTTICSKATKVLFRNLLANLPS